MQQNDENFNNSLQMLNKKHDDTMETIEEKQTYLMKIYHLACARGLCDSKTNFAAVLGINRAGLSAAMNGDPRNCTPSLIRKVQDWAQLNGLETPTPQQPAAIPTDAPALYEYCRKLSDSFYELSVTCRNISDLLNKLNK